MAYDGASSIYAKLIRVTKLDETGAPLAGEDTSYTSTALVQAQFNLDFEDGDSITQLNGNGDACLNIIGPSTLNSGTIKGLQICQPDPVLVQFLIGGDLITTPGTPADQIGYRAPQVGQQNNPNGVSVELWSAAYVDSAPDPELPFYWWVFPKCHLVPDGDWSIEGENAMVPEFTGTTEQNSAWGAGPDGEWTYGPSNRVWQYVRTATMPERTTGFVPIEEAA